MDALVRNTIALEHDTFDPTQPVQSSINRTTIIEALLKLKAAKSFDWLSFKEYTKDEEEKDSQQLKMGASQTKLTGNSLNTDVTHCIETYWSWTWIANVCE